MRDYTTVFTRMQGQTEVFLESKKVWWFF